MWLSFKGVKSIALFCVSSDFRSHFQRRRLMAQLPLLLKKEGFRVLELRVKLNSRQLDFFFFFLKKRQIIQFVVGYWHFYFKYT